MDSARSVLQSPFAQALSVCLAHAFAAMTLLIPGFVALSSS